MKKIVALGIVVAVIAIGYTIAWYWAAGQATDYIRTLETADGVSTPQVKCGELGISGFPFGFDLTCNNALVTSGDITVSVAGFKAAAEVWNPTHAIILMQSPVSFEDAFTGSRSRVDFASLKASARLSGWRIGRVSALIDAPVWNDTVLEDRLIARATHVEAHLIDVPEKHDAAAGLATLSEYAKIDGLIAPGFEIAAGQSVFEGDISNLPDDIRTYGDADIVKRWQAANGRLTIASFTGSDGDSKFDINGTLGLDSGGRAEGQLKLSSTGVVERLGDAIPPEYKGLVVGAPAADGSYSQTLNLAAGVVFSGLVPTAVIPPLF